MTETLANPAADARSVEALMREELALGDAMLGSVQPILRHLLLSEDNSLFSEEVLARVRGMLADLAGQLLGTPLQGNGADVRRMAEVESLLAGQSALLGHLHALAIELQLTERLQGRLGLDPVLSPLLQALIASPQPSVAADAMTLLAAQARFVQAGRRMQLPLAELPGDLLHSALLVLRNVAEPGDGDAIAASEARLRGQFDEARTRLGLLARVIAGMGAGMQAALSLNHAGAALFLSALSLAARLDRDQMVMATSDGQMARLALLLRAAGLKPAGIEEQFLAIHPDARMPAGFELLSADRASAVLAGVSVGSAG